MSWYSSVAQFAADHINARGRSAGQGPDVMDVDALNSFDMQGAEPEHRSFEAMRPMLALPSKFDTAAIDRVYTAFDVSQPVGQPEDLRGRDAEVRALLSGVLHRRNHAIVSGPRGSGKTSLVRVFGQYADLEGVVVLYSACDNGTSFGELLRSYLEQIPPTMVDPESLDLFDQRVLSFGADSSPYQATGVLAMLKYSQLVVVLDEFDRITDRAMHDKVSTLLKLVSDARLPVRFVLVGGNSAFTDIVRAHPSLMRHITRVSTEPLSADAIDELLDGCGQNCGILFTDASRHMIAETACGSPYHARLFGMHAALNAIADGSAEVDVGHVERGFKVAFEEWSMLNPVDAGAFRDILRGSFGPAKPMIDFAKKAAGDGGPDRPASSREKVPMQDHHNPGRWADLAETVELNDGAAVFRDATAPQFLLALDRTERGNVHPMKGGKRA